MKKWLTSFLILFIFSEISNAQNLVPNPGFEEYHLTYCGIMGQSIFEQTIVEWVAPNAGTPDAYFTNIDQSCYNFQPDSQYPGPIGLKGTQSPRTGKVMAGLWIYTIPGFNQREYLQVALNEPMEAGKTYIVSFYASLGDFMEKSSNGMGAYLSENPVSSSEDGLLDFTPQILAADFIDNVSNWVLISDTIVAQDNYNYLTIGNFFNDNSTGTLPNPMTSGAPGTYGAYYFIDDVSVVETIISSTDDLQDQSFYLFPNPVYDEINISLSGKESEVFIKVFNTQGLEMFQQTYNFPKSITIDCSRFPAGAYFIQLQSGGKVYTEKLMKH